MSHCLTLYKRMPHRNPAPAARHGSATSGLSGISAPTAVATTTMAAQVSAEMAPHVNAGRFMRAHSRLVPRLLDGVGQVLDERKRRLLRKVEPEERGDRFAREVGVAISRSTDDLEEHPETTGIIGHPVDFHRDGKNVGDLLFNRPPVQRIRAYALNVSQAVLLAATDSTGRA